MAGNRRATPPRRVAKAAAAREESREEGDRIIAQALQILESRASGPAVSLADAKAAADWFRRHLGGCEREVLFAAWLDRNARLVDYHELYAGPPDDVDMYLRRIVRSALDCNAVTAVIAHNRPSRRFTLVDYDVAAVARLADMLGTVGILMLDHFVIPAGSEPLSLAAQGVPLGRSRIPRGRPR